MKAFKTIYVPILVLLAFVTACSEIDEDERLIYVKPAPVGRNVLIEDFTGQRCVNCPTASLEIEKLQEQYGADTVIAVSIHSGPFAKSLRGVPYPLYTSEGDEYYNYWKVESQPMGVIDRTGTVDYTLWSTRVKEEVVKTAPLSLYVTCLYDEATRQADISVFGTGTDGNTTGKLQVWLTEDHITDFQLMPDGSRNDAYIHNHVLRCCVNGTWGTPIEVRESEDFHQGFSQTIDEAWQPNNMSVVAFIYNDDGVCQVTQRPVVER